jgi:hypothetical protein
MAALVRALGVTLDRDTGEILVPKGVDPSLFEYLSALSESALSRDEV